MLIKINAQFGNQELKNLSYHVVGVFGNKPEIGGTGFFIKKGAAFYLVSAWHSFSFKNHLTQKAANQKSKSIKEIIVYRKLPDLRANSYLRIGLINTVTNLPVYLSIYQNDRLFDISAIQVSRITSFEFDYFDLDWVTTETKIRNGDDVFYYGFPIKNGRQSDAVEYFEGKISEINLEVKEVVIDIVGYNGCSGAPLFIRREQNIYLWGVLFYALKDIAGRAEQCKAVNLNTLINRL